MILGGSSSGSKWIDPQKGKSPGALLGTRVIGSKTTDFTRSLSKIEKNFILSVERTWFSILEERILYISKSWTAVCLEEGNWLYSSFTSNDLKFFSWFDPAVVQSLQDLFLLCDKLPIVSRCWWLWSVFQFSLLEVYLGWLLVTLEGSIVLGLHLYWRSSRGFVSIFLD